MAARDYVIVFDNPVTERLSIRIPAWDDQTRTIVDDDEFLAWVREKDITVKYGVESHLVLLTDIPTDRTFRNAWEWSD